MTWVVPAALLGSMMSLAGCDSADSTGTPSPAPSEVTIKGTGANAGTTLSIPRYKIYQEEDDPENLWVGLSVDSGEDTFYSNDGGDTWTAIGALGWEMHMSMAGNATGYVHFIDRGAPAATYRRMHGVSFEPERERSFADFGNQTTSGNIAVHGNEIVVFTRSREDNSAPIVYHRSIDNGETWQAGVVSGTGNPTGDLHRIGSCVIDGQIALAYWQGSGADTGDTITLYRWNGTAFTMVDHVYTTATRSPWTREYGITQDAGGRIHLVTWDEVGGQRVVRHTHRTLAAAWSTPETVASWDNDDISPQLSARGDTILLLYLYNPNSSQLQDAQVYYKVWNPATGWSSEGTRLSQQGLGGARYPVAPQQVASGSSFFPVVWTQGETVRFIRLPVD